MCIRDSRYEIQDLIGPSVHGFSPRPETMAVKESSTNGVAEDAAVLDSKTDSDADRSDAKTEPATDQA